MPTDDARAMETVEFVVVRHGRTAWNASGRYQGHTDVELDEVGRAQARAVARDLATTRFDLAVASDLLRARETAKIVLAGHDVTLEADERLREMRFGAWEGRTWAEIVATTPELRRIDPSPRVLTPPGGETFADVVTRVAAAYESLRERVIPGGRVLVVTHAGPLHAFVRIVLGESESAALAVKFSPASITRFDVDASGARLVAINVVPEPEPVA